MAKVWLAFAGDGGTTEENLIGVYTSQRKAKRAVLAHFGLERGRWTPPDQQILDTDWLMNQADDNDAYGYVSQCPVE